MTHVFDLSFTLRATEIIASLGLAIGVCEELVSHRYYGRRGMYSWAILSTRSQFIQSKLLSFAAARLFDRRGMAGLQLVTLLALLIIALDLWPTLRCIALGISLSYLFLFQFRNIYGFDGSDQMFRIVFICLFGASLFAAPTHKAFFVWVLALHAAVAYLCSAIHKLKGPLWRKGEALERIMSTQTFGEQRIGSWFSRHRTIAKFATWGTIMFQLILPLGLFLPSNALIPIFALGLGFHIVIAQLMGLNAFVPAFVATYPSIAYVNHVRTH